MYELSAKNDRLNQTKSSEYKWSNNIQKGRRYIILYIHSKNAASCSNKKAPYAGSQSQTLILCKLILRFEFMKGLSKGNVRGKYPQITQGHCYRI